MKLTITRSKQKNGSQVLNLSIYAKHVTPYIRIMAKHIPEFLCKYGSLEKFTQQGIKKLNDQTKIDNAKNTRYSDTTTAKEKPYQIPGRYRKSEKL